MLNLNNKVVGWFIFDRTNNLKTTWQVLIMWSHFNSDKRKQTYPCEHNLGYIIFKNFKAKYSKKKTWGRIKPIYAGFSRLCRLDRQWMDQCWDGGVSRSLCWAELIAALSQPELCHPNWQRWPLKWQMGLGGAAPGSQASVCSHTGIAPHLARRAGNSNAPAAAAPGREWF